MSAACCLLYVADYADCKVGSGVAGLGSTTAGPQMNGTLPDAIGLLPCRSKIDRVYALRTDARGQSPLT